MTQEEIIQGNKLIAEFMGGIKPDLFCNGVKQSENAWNHNDINNPLCGGKYYDDSLKYHTSWNWLMPVVERCNSIINHIEYFSRDLQRALCAADIELVFIAVIEFIKWYNAQTQPHDTANR
jgi:hypothetical protein